MLSKKKTANALLLSLRAKPVKIADFNKHWKTLDAKTQVPAIIHNLSEKDLESLSSADFRGLNRAATKCILEGLQSTVPAEKTKLIKTIEKKLKDFACTSIPTDAERTVLGKGAVNVVYKVEHANLQKSLNDTKGIFKPDSSALKLLTFLKESLIGTAKLSGIPVGENSFLPERSVASARVGALIFGETNNISVGTEFAESAGNEGLIMSMAPGKSPKVISLSEPRELKERDSTTQAIMTQYNAINTNLVLSPTERKRKIKQLLASSASSLGARKLEVKNGKLFMTVANVTGGDTKLMNAQTAEDLAKLQAFDYLTGQTDRHPGNYFVDSNGKIKAIDNDCSFGVNAVPKKGDVRKQRGIVPNNASLMLNLPPVITKEVASQIQNLDKAKLKATLENLISPEELAATLDRLNTLQAHVADPSKCTQVATKDALILPDNLKKLNSNNSYLMRELKVYDQNKRGWNHLRVHRES